MSGVLDKQVDDLRARFGAVEARPLPGGAVLIAVPQVPLPTGWSAPRSAIRFLAPAGYPFAQPDCFWADQELRLAGGVMPQSAAPGVIPETEITGLWFSWHLSGPWDPNRDTLSTWVNVILDRLRRPM